MISISMPTHYKNNQIENIQQLRSTFPDAKADYLNFVLFSTDGVHGSNMTIEDCEKELINGAKEEYLTILIIRPRIVSMNYGHITITLEDIPYLKELRKSSFEVLREMEVESEAS